MLKNKAVATLLSVMIAFALWLYVITVVSPESEQTYFNIPVHLRGENILHDRGYMIVTEDAPTVSMTLSGNRTDLNNINSSNITLIVDLSTIDKAGTQSLIYDYAFPGNVADNAITVLEHPGKITLEIARRITKEVPVNVVYNKDGLPEDFVADTENAELSHEKVTITGPEDVIKQITQAVVEVDLEGRKSSFMESYRFALCDSEGEPVDSGLVETNAAQVSLTLKIQRLKELTIKFEIIDGGGATAENTVIEFDPKSIMISGPDAVLGAMDDTLVLGTIDLGKYTEDTELTFDIVLPQGLTNLSEVEEVKVTVKLPVLETRTIAVTQISKINVPDGMIAEIDKKTLNVTVRGPKHLVSKMKDTDIWATVDFSAVKPGNDQITADIFMKAEFAEVGALGTYKVSTTMHER
ncbi:MAG: hypothetical protein J6Q53_03345 [Oscillospiraceae bacterium]|nr:hypothetical protein [Oscillospiraceae bacterium]